MPILTSEKKFVECISAEITKALKKYSISVFLFGSVARKQETIKSDMDICIIYKMASSKKIFEEIIPTLSIKLYKKFGVSLAPFYISKSDFVKRAKSNKPPIADVITGGKYLCGEQIKKLLNG